MFCPRCRHLLPEQARFCPVCGAAVAGSLPPYYEQEFRSIAAGNPGRFNFAAFFLGPFHAVYRGLWPRFWKLYFPWLLVMGIGQLFACLSAAATVRDYAATGQMSLYGPPVLLSWLFSALLWAWGLGIAFYLSLIHISEPTRP